MSQHVSIVMHDLEAFEAGFELVGEAVVRLGGGDEEGVAAGLDGSSVSGCRGDTKQA